MQSVQFFLVVTEPTDTFSTIFSTKFGGDLLPCFHPLYASLDIEASRQAKKAVFHFGNVDPDYYRDLVKSGYVSRNRWRHPLTGFVYHDMLVPCRQCVGCRLEYSRQWANRMMLELPHHDRDSCYFITLTYGDDFVPFNSIDLMTLRPDDMTLFLKRLRKRNELDGFRYYYSGEYGDEFDRPHYHMICFSLKIPDLELLKMTSEGPIFISRWLDLIWKNGHCFVCQIAWSDCAYTARYVMKKLKGEAAAEYDAFDLVPEFSRMSRDPGLGSQEFSVENFEKGILRYVDGRPITVPDAWTRYMLGSDLDVLKRVRDRRSMVSLLNAVQATDSSLLPSQNLKVKEISILSKIKKL